ncbi:hypothetical protein QVG61_09705 [Thiohalobacter sp. IOR34]|uniref:hypothetical protein n=1 Tax=Thiohalobacter sp. IOR34 TaxID=3057176 RepID=UPI0025B0F334|nr:hypothetical protein [Thiohalobacter sp. IOR34]WJW74774.1 hypothetical protein QVG61_09705 [Thiohalobacter sp. IOR34]
MSRLRPWLLCLLAAFPPGAAPAETPAAPPIVASSAADAELQALGMLASAGAPQLVLARMDAVQPAFAEDPVSWMRWERMRIGLLESRRDWAALVARVAAAPADLAPDFLRWLRGRQAAALLESGQPAAARQVLRRLLWSAGDAGRETRRGWRRLVIRSYLLDDRLADARVAVLRYRQDFGEEDPEWRLLSGEVLLRSGRPEEAHAVLAGLERPAARPLRLLAALRSGRLDADQVLARARRALEDTGLAVPVQARLWDLIAQALERQQRPVARIEALERALALAAPGQAADGLFQVDAELLWQAYLEAGRRIGNREQLLVGRDQDWYFAATEALEKQPLRARLLFAVLGETASDPHRRELAHDYLAAQLEALPGGRRLLRALYLDGGRYPRPEAIPRLVRYRLVDGLLADGEVNAAAGLMRTIPEPPPGQDRFDWQLRRARVSVLAGELDEGSRLLAGLLEAETPPAGEALDRLLQVVFDLQRLKAHRRALGLLRRIAALPLPLRNRRELLFWMAESEQALGRHAAAARLYLASAATPDPHAMDPWAQTARYHAARELAAAGFVEDAAGQLQGLLNATRDAARQRVLRHELRRLRQRAAD